MKLLISIVFMFGGICTTNIYSYSLTSIDNSTAIDLSDYQGKKILFVNIATGSDKVGQLAQLEQLYQDHSDSLVVIAFPSNSFGHEPLTNSGIRQFLSVYYNISFPVASTGNVKGLQIQPVYQWLSQQSYNGVMDAEVKDDFQKFLVNGQGELIGVFAGSMPANHAAVLEAITQH